MGDAGEETKKAMRIAAMDGDGASAARASVPLAEQQRRLQLGVEVGRRVAVVGGDGAGGRLAWLRLLRLAHDLE